MCVPLAMLLTAAGACVCCGSSRPPFERVPVMHRAAPRSVLHLRYTVPGQSPTVQSLTVRISHGVHKFCELTTYTPNSCKQKIIASMTAQINQALVAAKMPSRG